MSITNRWPQVGDQAIDLRAADVPYRPDQVGKPVTVQRITQTLVITSDGEKYRAGDLYPVAEGRYSHRRLAPLSDPRVLCVQGRKYLAGVARLADNLAKLERKDPADIVGAFAQIISAAADARAQYISLTSAASRAEQESDR